MADITESAVWEDSIYELATTDPVKGGTPVVGEDGSVVSGHANVQAQLLANRTKYLKQRVDAWPETVDAAGTAAGLTDAHNSNPNAHQNLISELATKTTPDFVTSSIDAHNHSAAAHPEVTSEIKSDFASTSDGNKGSGSVGFSLDINYPDNTVGKLLSSKSQAQGLTTPCFVETLVSTIGVSSVPNNVSAYTTGTDVGGGSLTELEVAITSGQKGTTTITSSETSKVSGFGNTAWPCAIEYASGNYQFNLVTGDNGLDTINLLYPLSEDAAGAFLASKQNANLGQHLTRRATRAFAQHLYKQNVSTCQYGPISDKSVWLAMPPKYQTTWTKNTALSAYGSLNVNNIISNLFNDVNNANIEISKRVVRPTSLPCGVYFGTHLQGHGIDAEIPTDGKSGFVEFFVSGTPLSGTVQSVVVEAYIVNGTNITQVFSENVSDSCKRITVPFSSGSDKILLKVYSTSNSAYYVNVSELRVWMTSTSRPLVNKDAKIVTMGDSWFAWYNGQFARTLQGFMRADGGKGVVVNRSLGGMTTKWALAWFNDYVLAERPAQCIFHFYTNDSNSLTGTFVDPDGNNVDVNVNDLSQWRANIYKLCALCIQNGIEPIVVMPCATASVGQSQKHAEWARKLLPTYFSKEVPDVTGTDQLADPAAFINLSGKQRGRSVRLGETVLSATGSLSTDGWRSLASQRLSSIEAMIYDFKVWDSATFTLGVDTSGDGLSDGSPAVSSISVGTNTGNTFTFSVSGGTQLMRSQLVENNGYRRLKFDYNTVVGHKYMTIIESTGSTASKTLQILSTVDGGTRVYSSLTDTVGYSQFYRTDTAATANAIVYANINRVDNVVQDLTTSISVAMLVDLTALEADTGFPISALPESEVFGLIMKSIKRIPPSKVNVTDTVTGLPVAITVSNGSVVVV